MAKCFIFNTLHVKYLEKIEDGWFKQLSVVPPPTFLLSLALCEPLKIQIGMLELQGTYSE